MLVITVEKRLNAKGRWVAGGTRLEVIAGADAETLTDFVQRNVRPGTEVVTDGWSGYSKLPAAGYVHSPRPGNGAMAEETLPLVHIMISNLKAWLNGTFHGVSKKHLGRYLREWAYRFNRRHRDVAVDLLFRIANQPGVTYAALTS
jgi:transposase-like protein